MLNRWNTKGRLCRKLFASLLLLSFTFSNFTYSANIAYLPPTGALVTTSNSFTPVILKGVTVNPDNPFQLSFLLDEGNTNFNEAQLKQESDILIRYFLAALTTPENDLWVNLSPYENNRIIPSTLGSTDMGRDLLAQDYILKQLSASLTYPESASGKEYWNSINGVGANNHSPATQTFNKIWIVPNKTQILESGLTAFIKTSSMKVMTECDYLASQKNGVGANDHSPVAQDAINRVSTSNNDAFKTHILPLIEQDVNNGQNFAYLRQIHNAIVLAAWFKKRLKDTIYNQLYIDKKKIAGIDNKDPNAVDQIYNQYVDAFKQGVYNYVKTERGDGSLARMANGKRTVPICGIKCTKRAYFSGGYQGQVSAGMETTTTPPATIVTEAAAGTKVPANITVDLDPAASGAVAQPEPRLPTVAHLATPEDPTRDKSTGAIGTRAIVVSTIAAGVITAFVAGVHQRHKADLAEETVGGTSTSIVQPKTDAGTTSDQAKVETAKKTKAKFDAEIKAVDKIWDVYDKAETLAKIATAQIKAGQTQDAKATLATALEMASNVKNEGAKVKVLTVIAIAQAKAELTTDKRDAHMTLNTAYENAKNIKRMEERIGAFIDLVTAHIETGFYDDAMLLATMIEWEGVVGYTAKTIPRVVAAQIETGSYHDAIITARRIDGVDDRAETIIRIANAQIKDGKTQDAQAAIAEAKNIVNTGHRVKALIEVATAACQAKSGKTQDAQVTLSHAIRVANKSTDVDIRIEILTDIAMAQANAGLYSAAISTIDRIDRLANEVSKSMANFIAVFGLAGSIDPRNGTTTITLSDGSIIKEPFHRIPRNVKKSRLYPIDYIESFEAVDGWIEIAQVQAAAGLIQEAKATLKHAFNKSNNASKADRKWLLEEISAAMDALNTEQAHLASAQADWNDSVKSIFAKYGVTLGNGQLTRLWYIHKKGMGWKLAPKGFKEGEVVPNQMVYDSEGKFAGYEDVTVVRGSDGQLRITLNSKALNEQKGREAYDSIGEFNDGVKKGVRESFDLGKFGNEVKDDTTGTVPDSASDATNGGIDDREGLMRMEIQSDGSKTPMFKNMPVDIQNFSGFTFKIVSITRSKVSHS